VNSYSKLLCWGRGNSGQTDVSSVNLELASQNDSAVKLVLGRTHLCIKTEKLIIYCVGSDKQNQRSVPRE